MGSKERREREREERRTEILDAARRLLLEKGLHATTVNRIAKLSELSVGLIYFYFKSKEDIFAALQEEGLTILHDMIGENASMQGSCRDRLHGVALAYFRYSEEYKNYFDILNYFLTTPEQLFSLDLKKQVDDHGNRILSIIDDIIIAGCTGEELKTREPRSISIMFWSTIHGYLQFKKLRETVLDGIDFERLYLQSVDHFITGLGL